MKRKFNRTIGSVTFNEQHNFFHGHINGARVTMNQVTDREGKVKWLIREEIELYELPEKNDRRNENDDVQF